jgi:hypothetical protein
MKTAYLLSVVSLSLLAGCAAQTDAEDASADEAIKTATLTPGVFEMYPDPGHVPSACDVHTKLMLSNPAKAKLDEVVGGACLLAIMPNERSYALHQTGTSCGSKIYEGSFHAKDGEHRIKITDNRSRLCLDLLLAQIVSEETVASVTTTKYSMWPKPTATAVTETGTLFHSVGIGGENTGFSVRTSDDVFELVLDASAQKTFAAGKIARVEGTSTLLSGVETYDRKAIDVSDLLVCPDAGTVDCMPPTSSKLCSGDNRAWIEASCKGVSFVD